MMKKTRPNHASLSHFWLVTTAFVACFACVASGQPAPWCISDADEKRIDNLISKLTLEQKLGQLTQSPGGEPMDSNPAVAEEKQGKIETEIREGRIGSMLGAHGAEYTNRLQRIAVEESPHHIPIILGNDVIHGYRTIFPIPLGEAASWDLEAVERSARIAATEARAAGTHWTFAPMVDICRDPRWGRIAEGAGEDPFLGSAMAAARVRGFQGSGVSSPDGVLACAKHFAAYGAPEAGRDYNTVDISPRTLHEVHLPPFRAAVRAGVGTLMSSFNEINGVPASGDPHLLTEILREQWGFRGFVVSDWNSVQEMVPHGFAANDARAAEMAITAGVDLDMSSFTYRTHLAESVAKGTISEATIDQALRRILRMKFAVGLFDNPYADAELEKKVLLCKEHREAARDMARKSIVLLRNEGALLPLSDKTAKLAVIGPLADSGVDALGTWAGVGKADEVVTVLAALRERFPSPETVRHAKGCEVLGDSRDGFEEAVELAKSSDAVIMVMGEEGENMSGEGHCRTSLDLPGVQLDLIKAVHETGKPVVLVLTAGRPNSIPWCAENIPAILVTWHLGTECGHAITDVLFGDGNPSAKLPITFPRNVGQVPIYYAHKNTGRPPQDGNRFTSHYMDVHWTPLYAFGHGLSYTSFEFKNLNLDANEIGPAGTLKITAEITNTGERPGAEVAQLYIRDQVASVTRPVRQLCGFERITLRPGETKTATFTLTPEHLGFLDGNMQFTVEPGKFDIWIGPDSTTGLHAEFDVVAR